jgi:hypothetical protein
MSRDRVESIQKYDKAFLMNYILSEGVGTDIFVNGLEAMTLFRDDSDIGQTLDSRLLDYVNAQSKRSRWSGDDNRKFSAVIQYFSDTYSRLPIAAMRELFHDSSRDVDVRIAAVNYLGQIGDSDSPKEFGPLIAEGGKVKLAALEAISKLDPGSSVLTTWVDSTNNATGLADTSDILEFVSASCKTNNEVRYRESVYARAYSRFRGVSAFAYTLSNDPASKDQSIRIELIKKLITALINRGVYFSMSSSTLFGTSSTINFSDGNRTDEMVSSRFMPLLTSCLEVSRQILREALFSTDPTYRIKAINFFSVRDSNSSNPWVIPFIAFSSTESILLEDGNTLDKSISKAAVLKTEDGGSNGNHLVVGFLNASGERVWLPVKKLTLSSDSKTYFGFREAYLYYAN